MKQPLVFDIQRFSLDNGPGIRTTVFVKGCSLQCKWCHNPESIQPQQELAFHHSQCIACGTCESACPHHAIHLAAPERVNRDRCVVCGTCVAACPANALRLLGHFFSVGGLVALCLRDRMLYQTSKGGVTFSGGEPGLYPTYIGEVAAGLKQEGVHVALQTSGQFEFELFQDQVLDRVDLIYYDLKLMDPDDHLRYTGQSNQRILSNLRRLLQLRRAKLVVRTPLVPGITDSTDNLLNIRIFLNELDCTRHEILPYNSGGILKRERLGRQHAGEVPLH